MASTSRITDKVDDSEKRVIVKQSFNLAHLEPYHLHCDDTAVTTLPDQQRQTNTDRPPAPDAHCERLHGERQVQSP